MSDFNKYINDTVEVDPNREYWFVRTEHGKYYNIFRDGNYIAIGWNDITINDIRTSLKDPNLIKHKLAELSEKAEKERAKANKEEPDQSNIINLATRQGKQSATGILTKLQRFFDLKKGDVVVIPNEGSSEFSFGIVQDTSIYDEIKNDGCEYLKRRKVKWVAQRDFDGLDTIFYSLKKPRHAISSIKIELSEQIDKILNYVYFKDGVGHYVLRVKKKEDINASDLFQLGGGIIQLLEQINKFGKFDENITETIVKINVQSNGDILLKGGKCVVILSLVFTLISCGDSEAKEKLRNLGVQNVEQLTDTLNTTMKNLELDIIHRNY